MCGHVEKIDTNDEYTCSICGGDSCMTISQEIQTNLTWYTVEQIERMRNSGRMVIGHDWDECEEIEDRYEVDNAYDIADMGITVYEVKA